MSIRILLGVLIVVAQSASTADNREDVLFTRYFSVTTPIFKSNIPVKTCQALIAQADQIITQAVQAGTEDSKVFHSVDNSHLQIAGENLRSCATNDSLSRQDRDLAVGLYAWISIEQNKREHFRK